jgi:hypothetical protein
LKTTATLQLRRPLPLSRLWLLLLRLLLLKATLQTTSTYPTKGTFNKEGRFQLELAWSHFEKQVTALATATAATTTTTSPAATTVTTTATSTTATNNNNVRRRGPHFKLGLLGSSLDGPSLKVSPLLQLHEAAIITTQQTPEAATNTRGAAKFSYNSSCYGHTLKQRSPASPCLADVQGRRRVADGSSAL